MKIYLPKEINETECVRVIDKDTIRVYENKPIENEEIKYTDYYINSHYLENAGVEIATNDSITCINQENLTTSYYYRNDFNDILLIFFIMLFIVYFIFSKIIKVFFIGFRG